MPIYSYNGKRGKSYFFKFGINGAYYLRRGFKTKKAALEAEKDFKNKLLGDCDPWKVIVRLKFKDIVNKYVEYCFSTMKITTASDIKRQASSFYLKAFNPEKYLYQMTPADANKAWKYIQTLKINETTKNKKLRSVKQLFTWVRDTYGYYYAAIYTLPNFKDYQIKRVKQKKDILEVGELIQILRRASPYYYLAILTMYIYGYRLGELLGLKVDSIDFNKRTIENYQSISFKTGQGYFIATTPKTKKSDRVRSCSDEYLKLLRQHINRYQLGPKDFLFFNMQTMIHGDIKNQPMHENTFRRALKNIEPTLNPHMLRRSVVTHLSENNVSLKEIANYIGHDSLATTERYYLKISEEKKNKINQVIDELIKEAKEVTNE